MKRLAIITTHPIQYYAPVFKLLHQRQHIAVKVFYTWGKQGAKKHDPGFGSDIEWDIPLLDEYDYQWIDNTSAQPGSHNYKGVVNPDLNQQIANWQPNALLVFGWAYHSHLRAIRYFKNRLPVYFRGDSTLLDEHTGFRSVLKTIFLKWVYRHTDYAFYVGTNNKAYFKKYGLKENQLSFAPHAIDNQRFMLKDESNIVSLRKQLNIDPAAIVILFAGKLEVKKSPQLLLNAFLSLKQTGIHLIFAGTGELEAVLKNNANNHPGVHFIGFKNQSLMPAIYHAADLFCLPSKGPGESWGLAVNEAMACGKAILIADQVGCAPDLVKNNYNGLIFKSGDLNNLTSCLEHLLMSKDRLILYGKRSSEMIEQWNFHAIATAIENKVNNG